MRESGGRVNQPGEFCGANMESTERRHDRDLVGSLERGLGVLEILAAHPGGLTLTETAAEADLTRAAARRLLLTLVATGYATQDGRKFRLSPRLVTMARTWLDGSSLWTLAEPIMRNVSAKLGESCSAAVLSGEDVVYVARVEGRAILRVSLEVGAHLPAYCTSMGRVLLSSLPPERLNEFLARATIVKRTPKTLADAKEIAAAVEKARAEGFAIVDEELELGLRSIAVPIRGRAGQIIAAINVSTQTARFSVEEMRSIILPLLNEARSAIEEMAGL